MSSNSNHRRLRGVGMRVMRRRRRRKIVETGELQCGRDSTSAERSRRAPARGGAIRGAACFIVSTCGRARGSFAPRSAIARVMPGGIHHVCTSRTVSALVLELVDREHGAHVPVRDSGRGTAAAGHCSTLRDRTKTRRRFAWMSSVFAGYRRALGGADLAGDLSRAPRPSGRRGHRRAECPGECGARLLLAHAPEAGGLGAHLSAVRQSSVIRRSIGGDRARGRNTARTTRARNVDLLRRIRRPASAGPLARTLRRYASRLARHGGAVNMRAEGRRARRCGPSSTICSECLTAKSLDAGKVNGVERAKWKRTRGGNSSKHLDGHKKSRLCGTFR